MSEKNKKNNNNEEKKVNENKQNHMLYDTQNPKDTEKKIDDKKNIDEKTKEETPEEKNSDKSQDDLLREEIEQLRDERLRLLAEMENLRKRTDKEKIDSLKYGSFNFAKDIIRIDDNLSRALEAFPTEDKISDTVKNLIDGLKMVQKDFATIVEKHGIKKVEALHKKFDHNLHQAMVEIESQDAEEGIVIQEMQSGYTMHDRLLRPSMVGVSKKPNKEEKKS